MQWELKWEPPMMVNVAAAAEIDDAVFVVIRTHRKYKSVSKQTRKSIMGICGAVNWCAF